jgi:hypothetical protein
VTWQVYWPLWDTLRILNSSGNVEAVGRPTEMPSLLTIRSPSESYQVRIGVDWIPCSSTASHTILYIAPATSLPTVVIDALTAFSGTVIN